MSHQQYATAAQLPAVPPAPDAPGFDAIGGFNGRVFVTCQWRTGDKSAEAQAAAIIHALTGM